MMLFKIKGGVELPVEELEQHDLDWYASSCKHAGKRKSAQAERQRRLGGGGQAITATAPAAAIAKPPEQAALGSLGRDAAAVTRKLAELSENYHLVSPQTQVDQLPEGCSVSVSMVMISPDPRAKETYNVSGRLALSRDALARIAAAAGVDWDTQRCGRLDDGSDPRYVHYRAVGRVRNFDSSLRTISGEVEIDARDGSDLINEIQTKARRRKDNRDDGASQILELRKFILRHAESKAKNRAIADMGVRRSYDPSEITKPFAVAKLSFSGHSDDPEIRKVFAQATAASMMGGTEALFGQRPQLEAPDGSPPAPDYEGHEPPPAGAASSDDPDRGGYDVETDGEDTDMPPAQAAGDRY